MSELTVWSVCVGDKYDSAYVYALRDMVKKYLKTPHVFKCITKRKLKDVNTVNPVVPYDSWWSKLGLFSPLISKGPGLYFDLDVIITGSLDYLVEYTKYDFAAPPNWPQSGHGGLQSSVMAFNNFHKPYEAVKTLWPAVRSQYHGDQEFLFDLLGDDWVKIPGIGSYRYHVLNKPFPADKSVICFHGEPKPPVGDKCLSSYMSILDYHIKQSMVSGLRKGFAGSACAVK